MFPAVHRRAWLASLLLVATPACTRDIGLLSLPDGGTDADRPQVDLNPPVDSGGAAGSPGTGGAGGASGLCAGASVRFPDASGTCAGTLASRAHRYALCSCSDWPLTASLSTTPFSSNPTAYSAGPASAAVGVNGKLTASANLSIRGSLYASGSAGISASGTTDIYKTLHSAGPVAITSPAGLANVYGGDAYAAGDVTGALHVAGTLHVPSGATVGAAVTSMATTRETVSVPDPCDCTMPFDVTAVITATGTANDNASLPVPLSPDALVNPPGVVTLDIPCGRFFLTSIMAQSAVNLRIHGRALLAIAGGVTLKQGMTVVFDPGAELDLLIGGALTSYGPYAVGAYQPAPLRVWMAGSAPISLYGAPIAGGIFRAPLSDVIVPNGMVFYGSMVAASFDFGDAVQWSYDQVVLTSGVSCGDPQLDPVP